MPGPRHRKRRRTALGRLASAARWVAANAAAARCGTLLLGLVLARLVSPAGLGQFAVVMIALLAVQSLTGLGVTEAIARWRGDPAAVAPTAMTISLAAGVVICAGAYLGAPAIAAALGTPGATTAVRLIGLTAVLGGAGAVPRGLLQRIAPGRRVLADQVDNWLGIAVTVSLAASGDGPVSLAAGRIAGSVAALALLAAIAPWSIRPGLRRAAAAALARAAARFAASGLLICAVTTADLVVVGHLLSARDLGWYLLAVCLASWPVTLAAQPVRNMAPAAFARLRAGPQIAGSALTSLASLLACLVVPLCILIASISWPLVQLLYGPTWAPAADVLPWLAPLAALRVLYQLANDYLGAIAPARAIAFQLILLVTLVPTIIAGAEAGGIVGAASLQLAVSAAVLLGWYFVELRRAMAGPRLAAVRVQVPAAGAAAVALVAITVRWVVPDDAAVLVIGGLAALAVVGLLGYRMRRALAAVGGAAASTGPRLRHYWHPAAGATGPAAGAVYYPVLPGLPGPAADPALEPLPEPAATAPKAPGLGRKVRTGARWSMINTIIIRISNFAVGAVLARTVFGPRIWGLYAISQVILALLLSSNELGVSAAIIRWEGDIRRISRSVLTLSAVSSLAIYAGLYAAAPDLARLLGAPDATGVVRVLCLCVIIDGFAGIPTALLAREFAQGRRLLVDLGNFLMSTGVTLWLAFTGHGAMSFAWGSVAGCVVALVVANALAPYLVWPGWDAALTRRLVRYGLPLAGASLLVLAVFNVDSAIVGATLGPVMLGLYQLAFNVSSWPVVGISQTAARVSFAGFSRVADSPARLGAAFTRALAVAMALTIPPCVLLATLAEPLIRAIYGERWTPAAPVLVLLAMLGIMRVAYQLVYDCLAAGGKRQMLMWIQAAWLAALVPVLLFGAHTHGIVGVGVGHVIVAGGLVGPLFLFALRRLGIGVRQVAAACWRPVAGGILMAAASLLVIHVVGPGLAGLAAAIGAGLAAYLPIVFPMRLMLRRPLPEAAPELEGASAA